MGPSGALRQGVKGLCGEAGLARQQERSLFFLGQTGSPTSL